MNSPDQTTPVRFRAQMEPLLRAFGFTDSRIAIADEVLREWQGKEATPIKEFRFRHRKRRADLDWLVTQQVISQNTAPVYTPTLLLYVALYVFRKRSASGLFAALSESFRVARRLRRRSPEAEAFSFEEFRKEFKSGVDAKQLRRALALCDSCIGLYLSGAPELNTIVLTEQIDVSPTFLLALHRFAILRAGAQQRPYLACSDVDVSAPALLASVPAAHESAVKAFARVESDPDAAITSARSTLEAVLKFIAHQDNVAVGDAPDIARMLRDCRPGLALDGPFEGLCRALVNVANSICEIRNSYGDSHGRGPGDRRATAPEARLVVTGAVETAAFLLRRWESVRLVSAATLEAA